MNSNECPRTPKEAHVAVQETTIVTPTMLQGRSGLIGAVQGSIADVEEMIRVARDGDWFIALTVVSFVYDGPASNASPKRTLRGYRQDGELRIRPSEIKQMRSQKPAPLLAPEAGA